MESFSLDVRARYTLNSEFYAVELIDQLSYHSMTIIRLPFSPRQAAIHHDQQLTLVT
jgi:hypothetical protein